MSPTYPWSSISKWQTQSKLTFIESVRFLSPLSFRSRSNDGVSYLLIGRTGRAGKTGVAITFLSDADEELMYDLKNEITKSPVSRCPPELLKHPAAQTKMSSAMKRQRDIED